MNTRNQTDRHMLHMYFVWLGQILAILQPDCGSVQVYIHMRSNCYHFSHPRKIFIHGYVYLH